MDQGLNIAYLKLKPLCNSLAENPTKEKFLELVNVLRLLPENVVQTLHEFILFPFFINLQIQQKNAELQSTLLETLQAVLKRVHIQKIQIFTRLHMALIHQIYDQKSLNLVRSLYEEEKLNIINCIQLLFENATEELRFDIYSKKHGPQLSEICKVCILLAKNEKYRALRIKAIESIMAIAYVHDGANFRNKELRNRVADIFMFLLPGVTIGLLDVVKGDTKQGHKVTSFAIKALGRIIVLHMNDIETKNKNTITLEYPMKAPLENIDGNNVKNMPFEEKFITMTRTEQWYRETSEKLKTALNIIDLQNHDHPKVRYAMCDFCENIILHCPNNMSASLSQLVDILISLSEDDDLDVSEKSKNSLMKIFDKTNNLNITVEDIIQENLYNVLTTFPRVMSETDFNKKLNILNLLIGYLRIVSNNLENVLQCSSHLQRLILTLIHVSQLERSNISLIEEHAIRDFEVVSQSPVTWKQFTYLREKELLVKFQIILRLLAESRAISIIIDQLCDLYTIGENKNETIFIMNELIAGKFEDLDEQRRIINQTFVMYMEENNWNLKLNVKICESSEDPENVSLAMVHNNIIQTCLLVEGIGNMATALQENFKLFLFKTLYFILERAGSAQPLISAAGFLTLSNISNACGYQSVTDLIVDNTDYFSFHVTQKLKRLEDNVTVLDVLKVVMNYSKKEVLPSLMDIINKVLLQSCDKFQENNATSFLKVFLSFLNSLIRWYNININPINRHIKLLIEYKKTMDDLYKLYSCDIKDEFSNDDIPEHLSEDNFETNFEETNEENKKEEPPEYIKLTVAILNRSLNFLPNRDQQRKLLVLNILKFGIEIISKWENELLPIVHLIWSPFAGRFKEFSEPLVLNKSFDLLIVLARTSKYFIRHRTSQNIFGDICSNLKNLSKESYLKDRGSAYRYTQSYKLQLNLLKHLAELITNLEMVNNDVKIAMESSLPYLSKKQPRPLQELAINFYKTLAYYDFDSVWLFLIEIYGSKKFREELCLKRENEENLVVILKILDLARW